MNESSQEQACFMNGCIAEEQTAKVRILKEKYKNHHIRFNVDAPYLGFKKLM